MNPNTLMFIDHRITAPDIVESNQHIPSLESPVSLAYSGRLIAMKGVDHIPRLMNELARRNVPAEFTVFGSGPMEAELRREVGDNVHFAGFVNFEPSWKTRVRSNVDIMFFPHLQGDSSSTYYESMGCGVPVLGFANATLTATLRHGGGGWEVPRGNVAAAAEILEKAVRTPSLLDEHRQGALTFMSPLAMEKVFDNRVEHFLKTIELGRSKRGMG